MASAQMGGTKMMAAAANQPTDKHATMYGRLQPAKHFLCSNITSLLGCAVVLLLLFPNPPSSVEAATLSSSLLNPSTIQIGLLGEFT